MQQHLRRQAGVAKVDVSLVDGKVAIYPKQNFTFDPAAIFKAVYDSGVSVAEMTVVASGQLVNDPSKGLVFRVNSNEAFEVKPNGVSDRLKDRLGQTLRVHGLLYQKPPGKGKRKAPAIGPIEILEVLGG